MLFGEFSPKQAGSLPLPAKFKAPESPIAPQSPVLQQPPPIHPRMTMTATNVESQVPMPPALAFAPIIAGPSFTAEPSPERDDEQENEERDTGTSTEDLMDRLERRAEDLGVLATTPDEVEPYGLEVLEEESETEEAQTVASVYGIADTESIVEGIAALWGQHEELAVRRKEEKESALAIAVDARCLRLTSHPWVVELVEEVWNGRILFVRDEEGGGTGIRSGEEETPKELLEIEEKPEPTFAELFSLSSIFDISRLRVPKWQYWVRVLHFALLLLFFSLVLHLRSYTVTWYEICFYVIAGSYILDELDQISDLGIRFYLSDLWTYLDLLIIAFLLVFLGLRIHSLYHPPEPEPPVPVDPDDPDSGYYPPVVQGIEFTILGFTSTLLWPRFLAALDRIKIFGLFTIVCREMLLDSLFFIVPCIFILMGFTSAVFSVVQTFARYDATIAYFKIMGDMAQVFTGLYWNSYDSAVDEGFPGYSLFYIVLFIGVVNILLTPFLIAIVTNSFSKIYERTDAEYDFDLTFRVLESTLWQDEYSFLPPFNIIQVFIYPLRLVLPPQMYRGLERFTYFALCWPLILLVWALEVLSKLIGLIWPANEEVSLGGKLGREVVAAVDGERREITRLGSLVGASGRNLQSRGSGASGGLKDEALPTTSGSFGHRAGGSPRKHSIAVSRAGDDAAQTRMLALLETLAGKVEELGTKLDAANARIEVLSRNR